MMRKNRFACFILVCLPMMASAQDAATLFDPIYQVLTHPRCLNCHTATDYPRQGGQTYTGIEGEREQPRRHDQLVVRGADGFGAPSLQCGACHQDDNFDGGLVPGAPHWHLAPLSMAWEDGTGEPLPPEQLCSVLLDPSKNGNRSPEELFTHMTTDALVLWAWSPGLDREVPPLSKPEFRAALEAWMAAAGPNSVPPCP